MNGFAEAAAARLMRDISGRVLPECRKIELYTNSPEVRIYDPDPEGRVNQWSIPQVMDALEAFMLLDACLECGRPGWMGMALRERLNALVPRSRTERLVAQVYRILKIIRRSVSAVDARLASMEHVFQINYIEHPFAFSLHISFEGLELLSGFVALYMNFRRSPHPESYVEAALSQHYEDILAEVRYLSDEDGSVLHFRKPFYFNRHFRFRCCTARFRFGPEHLEIDMGERFLDKGRFPLDFYLMIEGDFYIIPCEVMDDGKIARDALPQWKVRRPDPAEGLPEFGLRLESEVWSSIPMDY